MKKIVYTLLAIFLMAGCSLSNTPTKQTENFFKKYQALDNAVLTDLNGVINADSTMNDNQKNTYRDIMKKHYQNLTYTIKEETIDGDDAVVTTEIMVTDFKKVMDEANKYLLENPSQFENDKGEYDYTKFNDYRLQKLKEAKDTVKYTVYISLTKINNEWTIDKIDKTTYDKINGTYNY